MTIMMIFLIVMILVFILWRWVKKVTRGPDPLVNADLVTCPPTAPNEAYTHTYTSTFGKFAAIPLYGLEVFMGSTPLVNSSYTGRLYRLNVCDETTVSIAREALNLILKERPVLAGRVVRDAISPKHPWCIALTGAGLPFSVRAGGSGAHIPQDLRSEHLHMFASFHDQASILSGEQPLANVGITSFSDGSGVIHFGAWHGMMDGSSMTSWVEDYARIMCARQSGLSVSPQMRIPTSRQALLEIQLKDRSDFAEAACAFHCPVSFEWNWKDAVFNWLTETVFGIAKVVMDTMLRLGKVNLFRRPVLHISLENLARLKESAGSGVPGEWITTQEALAAHISHAVARSAKAACRMKVGFLLDTRKDLGLAANHMLGGGVRFSSVSIDDVKSHSVSEIAKLLHCHVGTASNSKEKLHHLVGLSNHLWSAHKSMGAFWRFFLAQSEKVDLELVFNNQSKNLLPVFGRARALSVITQAGPCLITPTLQGVAIHFPCEILGIVSLEALARELGIEE